MTKREKIRFVQSVWNYLARNTHEAFEAKDELNFDWYSDGQQLLFCALREGPILIQRRVKPLS